LAIEYNKIYQDREIAKEFINGSHPLAAIEPTYSEFFTRLLPMADLYLTKLASAHRKCMANASNNLADCEIPRSVRMSFEPIVSLVFKDMQPPRLIIYSPVLSNAS
jgi:hypothetical protein